jgi:hypothetical protein
MTSDTATHTPDPVSLPALMNPFHAPSEPDTRRRIPVVLLNGPPRVGKDTAGRAIERSIYGAQVLKFAEALKRATHALYGLQVPTGYFEDRKDTPASEFFGATPRAAYIAMSERMVKPALGAEHFGRVMVRRIKAARRTGARVVVITDCGFASEIAPVAAAVGPEAMLLVRLHAPGRGCTFAGDSRSHVAAPAGAATLDINNDGTESAFCATVVARVRAWLDNRSDAE